MARHTKDEALATRHQLLDAAERVFAQKGVSRTSLHDIAQAAGVSRGAIYWHFKNKADLFTAMMERITLPMEDASRKIGQDSARDQLEELQCAILDAIRKIASDERIRRVFEVATLKAEYVDELLAVKVRQLQSQSDSVRRMQRCLVAACMQRTLPPLPCPFTAAQGLHALVVGLIHTWLMSPEVFELVPVAEMAISAYLIGLGFTPGSERAPTCRRVAA